jgi:hypothetical protein
VQWPVSGELTLYALVEHPLMITTEAGGHIVIDFDVGRSFLLLGSVGAGSFQFLPWIRAVNDAATGKIQGTVHIDLQTFATLSLANTAIEVYRSGGGAYNSWALAATGRTDAQGHFVVPLLAGGEYRVDAYPADYPWMRASVSGVTVTIGQSTTVNLFIGPDSTGGGGCCDTIPPPPDTTTPPPPSAGPLHHITMTPATQTVNVGDSISVLAVKEDSLNRVISDNAFLWSISDTTVVGRTWQGGGWILLRALKSGSATVTASDTLNTSISGTATVTVR